MITNELGATTIKVLANAGTEIVSVITNELGATTLVTADSPKGQRVSVITNELGATTIPILNALFPGIN